jgi:DNA-binding NarL/FixJ family response regulator
MISVLLVDDQTLVRQGIRSLLELSDAVQVVAEAADGEQAIELIPSVGPDVVLLDMRMPGKSGLDVLRILAERKQLPPTIILTTFDDDELVLAGLQAGARGYLLKDVTLEQLVEAVKTAHWSGRPSHSGCCPAWTRCRTASPASTSPIR